MINIYKQIDFLNNFLIRYSIIHYTLWYFFATLSNHLGPDDVDILRKASLIIKMDIWWFYIILHSQFLFYLKHIYGYMEHQ